MSKTIWAPNDGIAIALPGLCGREEEWKREKVASFA